MNKFFNSNSFGILVTLSLAAIALIYAYGQSSGSQEIKNKNYDVLADTIHKLSDEFISIKEITRQNTEILTEQRNQLNDQSKKIDNLTLTIGVMYRDMDWVQKAMQRLENKK